jgi:DNA-binding MarR family transcriptional regulator
MVPLLNRLEVAGLIERVALDRKSLAIVLTEAGRERLRQVEAVTAEFEAELIERIPEEHREHFVPALNALLR